MKRKSNKPRCKLIGTDGNVFLLAGKVIRTLKQCGKEDDAIEFSRRLKEEGSYSAALNLMMEYVEIY